MALVACNTPKVCQNLSSHKCQMSYPHSKLCDLNGAKKIPDGVYKTGLKGQTINHSIQLYGAENNDDILPYQGDVLRLLQEVG